MKKVIAACIDRVLEFDTQNEAAKYIETLRDGVFPWGYAVKLTNWSYFISSVKFTEYTGIKVPLKLESEG